MKLLRQSWLGGYCVKERNGWDVADTIIATNAGYDLPNKITERNRCRNSITQQP